MSHKYGALVMPVPVPLEAGGFPPVQAGTDLLLGYLGHFLATIMKTYAGDVWHQLSPSTPIVKSIFVDEPESGFNESVLPALYVFRAGRETREMVETWEQVADEYRFQKSRVAARWIMNPVQQANQRIRNDIVDAIRKVIDAAVNNGRDPNWIVPGDADAKAPTQGSSLCNYTGAAVIELEHAAPGKYTHAMMLPAQPKHYDELKMSFTVEEKLDRDLNLIGEPNQKGEERIVSPDQGTGLGNFDLGIGIYE